jgi:uncharacterized protein YecE (DUF72 family)
VTSDHPFLRIVGRNNLDEVTPWIDEWAPVIADWLREGKQPFVFTHAPDDQFAPEFGRRLYSAVREQLSALNPMPAWPGESSRPSAQSQKTLF